MPNSWIEKVKAHAKKQGISYKKAMTDLKGSHGKKTDPSSDSESDTEKVIKASYKK